jgi:signal transduction histidine kinase
VVHSAALQAVALKDPEKASRNAALVGDMGRQALNELRTMLGVLRSPEDGPEHAGPGGVSVRLAEFAVAATGSGSGSGPERRGNGAGTVGARERAVEQGDADGDGEAGGADVSAEELWAGEGRGPSLAQLDVLVGQSREAGMSVDFSVDGSSRGYEAGVEQTAFRVVQEALTNVHKHAPGARTSVRLAHREGEVAVQVENERPVDGEDAASAGLPSGGNGLVGMRERVTALGGGFVSGPTDVGGFRVSAVIPARRTG